MSIHSYEELIDPLFGTVETAGSVDDYFDSIGKLERPLVLLFACHLVVAEVNNGGFSQLFFNSTGILVPEATEGLAAIGMLQLAAIVEEAARLFGAPYPRHWERRREELMKAAGEIQEDDDGRACTADRVIERDLLFSSLSTLFFELENIENGGFEQAATGYAQRLDPLNR
jgi:hypothetical protein